MNVKKKLKDIKENIKDSIDDGTLIGYIATVTFVSVLFSLLTFFSSGSIVATIITFVADEIIFILGFIIIITIYELTRKD